MEQPDRSTDPILERLSAWAEARDDVRALLLTSSLANPSAPRDALSDYDVVVLVRDIEPYLADESWLEDFGRVIVVYRDPVGEWLGVRRFTRVTQYMGWKIDFTLCGVELADRLVEDAAQTGRLDPDLDNGCTVLLDKDGCLERLPKPTFRAYIPEPPSETRYREVIELFFHEGTYAAKSLWREDLLAYRYFLDAVMKLKHVRTMLEWRMEIDHGWTVKTGVLGRGLRRWSRPETWEELENTFTGPGWEAGWEAFERTVVLFRRLAQEVGAALGYAYPQEMDDQVTAYFRKVRAMPRPGAEG